MRALPPTPLRAAKPDSAQGFDWRGIIKQYAAKLGIRPIFLLGLLVLVVLLILQYIYLKIRDWRVRKRQAEEDRKWTLEGP